MIVDWGPEYEPWIDDDGYSVEWDGLFWTAVRPAWVTAVRDAYTAWGVKRQAYGFYPDMVDSEPPEGA